MQSRTIAYDSKIEGEVIVTKADSVINWIRKHSVWPMPMGLACCAIELMATGGSRFDISRFGMEVMRFSPRQADCMIVAGTVTYKMAEVVRRIYDQMAEPKWVVAMGACASTGGMYRSYAVLQGVDRVVPVDVYVSGCPPRPEALLDAMIKLQDKIGRETSVKNLFPKKEKAIVLNAILQKMIKTLDINSLWESIDVTPFAKQRQKLNKKLCKQFNINYNTITSNNNNNSNNNSNNDNNKISKYDIDCSDYKCDLENIFCLN